MERLSTDIGSRPVGEPATEAAADYVAEALASLGYGVERQPIPYQRYVDSGSQVTLELPRPLAMDARVMQLSAQQGAAGRLVDVGLGRSSDFAGKAAGGGVALAQRGGIPFQQKAANAMAAGALGLIVSNNQAGFFEGSLVVPATIPVVGISQGDGQKLRTLLQQGEATVRLAVKVSLREGISHNVVATHAGSRRGIVIVGAHYDSVAAGPGANDNASGVASVLEIARSLSARDYPFTVKVIAFTGEEIGHLGSRGYVSALSPEERQSIVAMVNLDMVGVGGTLTLAGTDRLVGLGSDAARRTGLAAALSVGQDSGASDHAAFLAAGIPALYVTWGPDPGYHTAEDRARHVEPELLAATARLVLDLLTALTSAR